MSDRDCVAVMLPFAVFLMTRATYLQRRPHARLVLNLLLSAKGPSCPTRHSDCGKRSSSSFEDHTKIYLSFCSPILTKKNPFLLLPSPFAFLLHYFLSIPTMKPTEYPHYHPNYDALPPCQGFTLVNSARLAASNDSCGGPNNDRRTTFRTRQERRQHLMQIIESAIAIMDEDLMIEKS